MLDRMTMSSTGLRHVKLVSVAAKMARVTHSRHDEIVDFSRPNTSHAQLLELMDALSQCEETQTSSNARSREQRAATYGVFERNKGWRGRCLLGEKLAEDCTLGPQRILRKEVEIDCWGQTKSRPTRVTQSLFASSPSLLP
jgi:hypothetical protein